MSDATPKHKVDRSELITELFRILKFMASDEDVPEPYFRIAFRIAQYANANTGWAIVSDRTLVDVIPRTDHKKLRKFRRHMEAIKWLRTLGGERGRPTSYLFISGRIPEIEKRLAIAAEKRESEFSLRKSHERTALHVAALGGQITPGFLDGEIGLPGQSTPPSKAGESFPFTGSDLPALLPKRTTSTEGYQGQDLTQDACALARSDLRCSCGDVAVHWVRNPGNPHLSNWQPQCEDCADDWIGPGQESRPIGVGGARSTSPG